MSSVRNPVRWLAVAMLVLLSVTSARADLTLGVPPNADRRDLERIFTPLAGHIGDITGETVNVGIGRDWLTYQSAVRGGEYDLVFAGPHIVAWLVENQSYEPLVKLPSLLGFLFVVRAETNTVNGMDDLLNLSICTRPPPDLGSLLLYESFPNPVRQPVTRELSGSDFKILSELMNDHCDAAILSTPFYFRSLSDAQRALLRDVHHTRELLNMALAAGPKVSFDHRDKIAASLTQSEAGIAATSAIRQRYDRVARSMVRANMLEYSGYSRLLKDYSFGW